MNENTKFRIFYILPPIIITVIICIVEKNPVAIVSFLLVFPIWFLLLLFFSDRIRYYYDEKNKVKTIIKGLNISKSQWRKFSDLEKEKYKLHYFHLEKIKREIITKRYWKKYPKHLYQYKFQEEEIKLEVENEWINFSLEERIKFINKYEIEKKEEAQRINKIRYDEAIERYKKEKDIEDIKSIEEKKLKIKQEKENEINFRKEKELAIKREEVERELKINEEQEREEQKRVEEIKQKELLELRKEQENERLKEYIKRQIREKEKRKLIASKAIEEMIESGELNENFSSNRNRENIPSHIKEAVWIRDKESCITCGGMENLEFDHIIPISKGGSNSINNIQLLCLKCNRSKSNKIM